ncbi:MULTISPECIES: hypothetical protein [Rhizobium]|uniref:Uncharacterized protein n=1 Tax=Rhizobium hidalgonense TaxID=1538159 RepID=A0ABX4JSH3_9HYPH|nr:hypothetical protein [Rhizobium hidalgonense]PDT21873.1 hypothetical protein CO674_20270 [Rhizobium hidalgonense]PON08534.1 hypothetical protein ATY29_05970 [Rhizobium hidalgonense]UWU39092.1 hypothetical protein N2597_32880 [Rhizobium leguminosarum bv. phaseoli]
MVSFTTSSYRFDLTRLAVALLILGLIFITARLSIGDSLTVGYVMVIPVYVFLSAVLEDARLVKHSRVHAWAERLAAFSAAAACGYTGYQLWISGY